MKKKIDRFCWLTICMEKEKPKTEKKFEKICWWIFGENKTFEWNSQPMRHS